MSLAHDGEYPHWPYRSDPRLVPMLVVALLNDPLVLFVHTRVITLKINSKNLIQC